MSPVAAPVRARRATTTARAGLATPLRTPPAERRRVGTADEVRRHLRVVDDARAAADRRHRRVRALVMLSSAFLTISLFALAAFHAMLASGQARLDELERRVSDAQAQYESLRLEVAELEAPSRIVREAQERLGMVPPPDVTYLSPSGQLVEEVSQGANGPDPSLTYNEATDRAPWATVKPYVSGRI